MSGSPLFSSAYLKHFFGVLAFTIGFMPTWAMAQITSYIYIQGDKETPFYVKLNGVMQARYSKHYCIVPKLSAGVDTINILFQQNKYPEEQFVLEVTGTPKGYLLHQKDNQYVLYDLKTKQDIAPNKIIPTKNK